MTEELEVPETLETMEIAQAPNPTPGQPCLIVLSGPRMGGHFPVSKTALVIGRSPSAQVTLEDDGVSRKHAAVESQEKGFVRIRDLGSTNGTFVNEQLVQDIELRDGDLIQVGSSVFKYLAGSNVETRYHEDIYRMSTIDGLTQAFNRRYFGDALAREVNRSSRHHHRLAVVIMDVDHFKTINDTYGHPGGDFVLVELTRLVLGSIRKEDVFARYGGEEFAIILPETGLDPALLVTEKLRALIEAHDFVFEGTTIKVTVSMGVHASVDIEPSADPEKIISAADARLYDAKRAGRNRVCS